MIVGSVMMPTTSPAVSAVSPESSPKAFWTAGARYAKPSSPRTTEGTADMNSTTDFMTSLLRPLANSERYRAAPMAIGTASSRATPVTHSEPTSAGRKPNEGGSDVGYQSVPVIMFHRPWL